MTWSEQLEAQGVAKGLAEGKAEGVAEVLVDLVARGLLGVDEARGALERLVATDVVPAASAVDVRARLSQAHGRVRS